MARVSYPYRRCMLFCFLLLFGLVLPGLAQDEEQVFSGDDAFSAAEVQNSSSSPAHLATTYWQVTAVMDLTAAVPGARVQMLVPLSDGRQSILARRASADGVRYHEEADGLNLWGHWQVTDTGPANRQILYEYTVQIVDSRTEIPTLPFPLGEVEPAFQPYLLPSAWIQSDAPQVRAQVQQLVGECTSIDQVIRTLYEYITAFPPPEVSTENSDALSVLNNGRGGRAGKSRALVALLRAAGIPARVVGGIRLGDSAKKRTTVSWVEALIGETWVPMDPTGGYFAWLPNTYLALYRNDLPLLTHSKKLPVEYTFFIRQLTRSAALAPDQPSPALRDTTRRGVRYESEHLQTIAAYVDRPRANIVLINDGPVSQEVVDRILTEAQAAQVNIAVLSIASASRSFRDHYLQSLVSNNLPLIREANLLLVSTADTAGFYALLKQGELGIKLRDLHLVMANGVMQPVARVLASVVLQLLQPAEIVLVPLQSDVTQLWELARSSVPDGLPLAESVTRWQMPVVLLNPETVLEQGWWRQRLIALWTLAVQAQVSLPALNLILVLPLIAFFLVIIRNVIGLETFGTFSPMLLALAFLTTGLGWGLVVFAIIVGLGTGLRLTLQHLRLHLVSRVAILIAVVSVSMAGLIVLGATFGVGALLHASIFPMVIMANMIENFTNTQLERGTGEALRLTLSTLLVATCAYVGIENTGLKPLVFAFPEILVVVIGVELLLGRWRGLRLIEYLRFYDIVRQPAAEPEAETRKISLG
jgi:transglutaminase-like putative cysteine protease